MRVINSDKIIEAVSTLCREINFSLSKDLLWALEDASRHEESEAGKRVLDQLKKNAEIAKKERLALCQDCGLAVVFVEMGQEVCLEGETLEAAVNQGVREGYRLGYLRKSVVRSPLDRVNTGHPPCPDSPRQSAPHYCGSQGGRQRKYERYTHAFSLGGSTGSDGFCCGNR